MRITKMRTLSAVSMGIEKARTLPEVFTAKDYAKVQKRTGASCLDTMRDYGVIVKVGENEFNKEIPLGWNEHSVKGLYNANGEYVMTVADFNALPKVAKDAMVAQNGKPFDCVEKNTKTIVVKQYLYSVDEKALDRLVENSREYILEEAEEQVYKLNKKIEKYKAIIATLGEDEE